MYNFLKIKNNSKLLHIYFPLFLVEHSARVSRFLKHIKVNLRKKKNPHTNLVLKYLKINALKEKKIYLPTHGLINVWVSLIGFVIFFYFGGIKTLISLIQKQVFYMLDNYRTGFFLFMNLTTNKEILIYEQKIDDKLSF